MIEIIIRDTENRAKPMTLTGELGFAVIKTSRDKEGVVHTGSAVMGEIDLDSMPRDIAAMGKETRNIIKNLDDDKANGIIRVLSFKCGFEGKGE